jgi:magnesium-protoporphyrin O-methyltransferase
MSDCCTPNYDSVFSANRAKKDLKRFRRKGPDQGTRLLIDALRSAGVRDKTLLDIGGGIGAIDHELLDAGARSAVYVDASAGFIEAAKDESARRGTRERLEVRQGDFVAIAGEIQPADVVTLDRVICCYPNMEQLVAASAAHARELYGIVIPRKRRITAVGRAVINTIFRVTRNPFRFHVHDPMEIERVLRGIGFHVRSVNDTLFWRVAVFAKVAA